VKVGQLWRLTESAPLDLPRPNVEFCCRVGLVAIFAAAAHQISWEWLRFLTSECVLRISAFLGMTSSRVSFDIIVVGGQAAQFVISCTFVDVFMGSIPLLWNLEKSVFRNILRLLAAATLLFAFNVLRLEFGHVLYYWGAPWTVADQVLGGLAYFAVWLAIWRLRSWKCCEVSKRILSYRRGAPQHDVDEFEAVKASNFNKEQ
jgi:exosortase/archaeosortase